jgi:hypothetical protein
VIGLLIVLHGVAVLGLIRAADLAAGETHAQPRPTIATRQAWHTPARTWGYRTDGSIVNTRTHVPSFLDPQASKIRSPASNPTTSIGGSGGQHVPLQETPILRCRQHRKRSRPIPSGDHRRPAHGFTVPSAHKVLTWTA